MPRTDVIWGILKEEASMDRARVSHRSTQRKSTFLPQVLGTIVVAAAALGCSPEDRGAANVSETADDIIGGFPATSARLNAIGAIGLDNGNGVINPFCTGTL